MLSCSTCFLRLGRNEERLFHPRLAHAPTLTWNARKPFGSTRTPTSLSSLRRETPHVSATDFHRWARMRSSRPDTSSVFFRAYPWLTKTSAGSVSLTLLDTGLRCTYVGDGSIPTWYAVEYASPLVDSHASFTLFPPVHPLPPRIFTDEHGYLRQSRKLNRCESEALSPITVSSGSVSPTINRADWAFESTGYDELCRTIRPLVGLPVFVVNEGRKTWQQGTQYKSPLLDSLFGYRRVDPKFCWHLQMGTSTKIVRQLIPLQWLSRSTDL